MSYIIPATVVDDFFDDPIGIRNIALKQQYFPSPDGRWPGERTQFISDANFVKYTMNKFLSLFYDVEKTKIDYAVRMCFQKINESFKEGWVHSDNEDAITGIIYLNPEKNLNSGTTIYTSKNVIPLFNYENEKRQSYLNKIDDSEKRLKNNAQFEESIIVKNKFNRLLAFDSLHFHAANDFFGNEESSRLTLVFFINELLVNRYPIHRLKNNNY